ncbi:hypothetical protein AXE80_02905 [Wenyingzhuangia fucanilytica]|uniref:Secretion system C-terminal sorting domain-containing protein n=1 Tax=Wenyingzhuangia fucanilytica TaxID=1790137 RepID=A0A1B1Y3I1_9FLAO|nr:T9SS type A sorting domain-containing protein [Wenyingzhuangia fucanilytica]ANW95298.1 hypothetical protein AXE80_02905 [Wenyingzhuangia fucanilytica]
MKKQLLKKRFLVALAVAFTGIQMSAQANYNTDAWDFELDGGVNCNSSWCDGGTDIVTAWRQVAGFELSSEQAQSGTYSMKNDFTITADGGKLQTWRSQGNEGKVEITVADQYTAVAWFYITGTGITEGSGTFRMTLENSRIADFNLTGLPINTWTKVEVNFSTTHDAGTGFWSNINFISTPTVGSIVYVDNISFVPAATLSVEKNTLEDVAVYPNPTKETLSINSPAGSNIVIYNLLGATVKSINNANALQDVSVSNLKSGMYMVRVTNNGKVYQDKIIKL